MPGAPARRCSGRLVDGPIVPPVVLLQRQPTIVAATLRDIERMQQPRNVPLLGVKSFTTNFPANETPMSQGGIWLQGATNGIDWNDVNTSGGKAIGAQPTGSANFDDAVACLNVGYHPDQISRGTVGTDGTYSTNTHELEVLLRWNISANSITGYECNYAYDGTYTDIVSWDGAQGVFTVLVHVINPSTGPLQTGDELIAQIVGDAITVSLKRSGVTTQINSFTDTASAGHARWPSGNPGLGFWHTDNLAHLYFSSWSAAEL